MSVFTAGFQPASWPIETRASAALYGFQPLSSDLVTLSDLTKSIQQKANEIFGRAGAAGSGVGEGGGGSKKKLNLPANPLADAAASAALAHEDKVHRDVEAFEALQAKHREEEVREHEAHLSLSWMLEQAGELAPPPAPASDEASNDATSKLVA